MIFKTIYEIISFPTRQIFRKAIFKMSFILLAGIIAGLSSADFVKGVFHQKAGEEIQVKSDFTSIPQEMMPVQTLPGDVVEVKKLEQSVGVPVQPVQVQPIARNSYQTEIPLPTRPAAPIIVQQVPVLQPAEAMAATEVVPLTPSAEPRAEEKNNTIVIDSGQSFSEARIAFIGGNNAFTMK